MTEQDEWGRECKPRPRALRPIECPKGPPQLRRETTAVVTLSLLTLGVTLLLLDLDYAGMMEIGAAFGWLWAREV